MTLPAGVAALAAQLPTLQLWSPLKPSPKQLRWVLDPRPAAMFGGAAYGGKSVGQIMAALMSVDQPHYRALIVRSTLAELKESGALIDMAHEWLDDTAASWSEIDKTWTFPSGAKIVFGYLADHNVKRYLGSQWHFIGIDECTEVHPDAAAQLRTRLRRNEGDPLPLRFRGSTNPVGKRLREKWTGQLKTVVGTVGADEVVIDVGVGEGLSLERFLPTGHKAIGAEYRHDKAVVAMDRLSGLSPVVCDAGMLPLATGSADLVTCIEVLEHLVTDEPAVAELARVCRGRCVVSVPWEPWFRLVNLGRGKNVNRIGNDPEHVQQFIPNRLKTIHDVSILDVTVTPPLT